jgi:Rv2632c-like
VFATVSILTLWSGTTTLNTSDTYRNPEQEATVVQPVGWHIEVESQEDDTRAEAAARLRLRDGVELAARGTARRNPDDPAQPQIGEEIAAARALSDLVHQLLDKAATQIEDQNGFRSAGSQRDSRPLHRGPSSTSDRS